MEKCQNCGKVLEFGVWERMGDGLEQCAVTCKCGEHQVRSRTVERFEKIAWPMVTDIEFVERLMEQAPEALSVLLVDVSMLMRKLSRSDYKGVVDQEVLNHKLRLLAIDVLSDFYRPQRNVMRLLAFDSARKNPNEHVACLNCDSRCVVAFDRLQQRMECGDCDSVMVYYTGKWELEEDDRRSDVPPRLAKE